MPLYEAVLSGITTVTQPHLTLPAIPGADFTAVTHFVVSTPSSLELGVLRFTRNPYRKVAQRKSGDQRWPATRSSTTAVITHELSCQLQSEFLHVLMGIVWEEVLLENVRISDCLVKKEKLVELSTLCSTGVVPTKLISTIHTRADLCMQLSN